MAVYKANWYELPPSVSKSFLLIMIRASNPITITAGKFFAMSLNNFTGVSTEKFVNQTQQYFNSKNVSEIFFTASKIGSILSFPFESNEYRLVVSIDLKVKKQFI